MKLCYRFMFYLMEVALVIVLCLVPFNAQLQALTVGGLFFHLTQSLGMLLFEWRIAGMGLGKQSFLGMTNATIIKGVMAIGIVLMMSWPLFHSDMAWVFGIYLLAFAVEGIFTDGRKNRTAG